jgi:CheY-like chemotaxis protein
MSNRVLVIEDEDPIRQFLQRGLTYENYRVDVAADGVTGLALARENPPDIVVLDWMLKGMDGLEVCRRLRAAGPVPILMLTAKDTVGDRVMGLDAALKKYMANQEDYIYTMRQCKEAMASAFKMKMESAYINGPKASQGSPSCRTKVLPTMDLIRPPPVNHPAISSVSEARA